MSTMGSATLSCYYYYVAVYAAPVHHLKTRLHSHSLFFLDIWPGRGGGGPETHRIHLKPCELILLQCASMRCTQTMPLICSRDRNLHLEPFTQDPSSYSSQICSSGHNTCTSIRLHQVTDTSSRIKAIDAPVSAISSLSGSPPPRGGRGWTEVCLIDGALTCSYTAASGCQPG